MQYLKILLFLFCSPIVLSAQSLWLEPLVTENTIQVNNRITGLSIDSLSMQSLKLINYNPAVRPEKLIELKLTEEANHQCHIFTIYHSEQYQKESLVWSAKNNQEEKLLLTDHRLVDLSDNKFMNFIDQDLSKPQINVYHHFKQGAEINQLLLGTRPANQAIPVSNFEGVISEIIFFNKILAPQARQILESSLAIKYGIPLQTIDDYLDEHGNVIWKIDANSIYQHNISGLGKSMALNLNQKQSKTTMEQGFIAFGNQDIYERNDLNDSEIINGTYLLWADNKQVIDFEKLDEVEILSRKWLLSNYNYTQDSLAFLLEHKGLKEDLEDQENYWLYLSESEELTQELGQLELYKLQLSGEGFYTSGISLPSSKESYFGIIKAPSFWALVNQEQASCDLSTPGNIQFKLIGGFPPYTIQLYNEDQALIDQAHDHPDQIWTSSLLEGGSYHYDIVDNQGNNISGIEHLNYEDFEDPELKQVYLLNGNEKLVLDASTHLPEGLSYQWLTPSGSEINGPIITLEQTGNYELLISKSGCTNKYNIEVKGATNNIEFMNLSPNPTGDGLFVLQATLKTASRYQVQIFHSSGVLMSTQSFEPEKFIQYQHRINQPGTYLIKLQTGSSFLTKKLIVLESH